jgi:hypothetical protein
MIKHLIDILNCIECTCGYVKPDQATYDNPFEVSEHKQCKRCKKLDELNDD